MFENIDYATIKAVIISMAVILVVGNIVIDFVVEYKQKKTFEQLERMSPTELDAFIKEK